MIVCSNYLISEDCKMGIITSELVMDDKGNKLEIKDFPDLIVIGYNGDIHRFSKCYIDVRHFDNWTHKVIRTEDGNTEFGMTGIVFMGVIN